MTLNTSEVLDLSKENVQPLRQGRKAAHLKTALQAQTDPETQYRLQKQREKFENTIRMYDGNDPLEPYWEYVAWLEQSYTKLGRESNLIPLIEDALIKFKDNEKYKQDSRFVQLLIKYISVQSNPLELYQLAYSQGLGTMCSSLYKAWAEELDKSNDFKRADHVYQLGIRCRAQPLEELEEAHVQFQLSIARRVLEGNSSNTDSENENTRSALSKLQPSKVKTSRISKDTAGVFQLTTRNSESKKNAVSVGKFKVYQEDENDEFAKTDFRNKSEKLPKGSVADRENIMKASKWCGQKQKQSAVFRSSMPTTPSFQIHEDPDAECENFKTVIRPRALKIRREEYRCPVAIFEDPDPSKKPMYPKHLVYVGGRDIQLEELRAVIYWKRIAKEQEKFEQMSISKEFKEAVEEPKIVRNNTVEQMSPSKEFKEAAEELKIVHNVTVEQVASVQPSKDMSNERACRLLKTPTNQPIPFVKTTNSVSVEQPTKLESKTEPHSINETSQKNESTDVDALVGSSEKGSLPPLCSPSTSFTVNTRAAMNVIQQMWESPLPPPSARRQKSAVNIDDSLFKVPLNPPKMTLDFDSKENSKPAVPFSIFCDDQSHSPPANPKSAVPFSIFCDDQPPSPLMKTPEKYSIPFIVPVNLADTPLEPENKENCPPKCYATPIERRPLSGILTSATDIPVKEVDSEDSENDDDYCKVLHRKNEDFDDETCSTKAFAIALPSSTPFARPHHTSSSRKSLVYNGSYISEDNTVKNLTENSKYVNGQHLSLILENSKEQGSNSSGGSSAMNK